MKKLANFLVEKRYFFLAVMLVAAVICAVMTPSVELNKDLSKYLPDDSNMRQGLAIMEEAFSESEETASIRVMFRGLDEEEAEDIYAELEALPNVSDVEYVAEDEKYRRDDCTLYVVNTSYDYSTDEERSLEKAIAERFSDSDMVMRNNDLQSTKVTVQLLVSAVALALIILLIMSKSWLEPVLIVAGIGVAVVVNLGTNKMFPFVSEMTATLGPVIQMALSMDYFIILMNRYRQEKTTAGDKQEAMKRAIVSSVSSIASSALTTVAGLLALTLLSFQLGPELGIMLAKGVLISMLCAFTVLPSLILAFDGALEKSRKRTPPLPTGLAARFSYAARFVMPVLFVMMFAVFYVLQSRTAITFTREEDDPIADVFPRENQVVLVYDESDESGAREVVAEMEEDEHVLSAAGYVNTLGAGYTASDMAQALGAAGGVALDESVVQTLYYAYFQGEELPSLTAEEFIAFLRDDVLKREDLSAYVDVNLSEQLEKIETFSDAQELTTPMTTQELSEFFGMDADTLSMLSLLFSGEMGSGEMGSGEMGSADIGEAASLSLTPRQFIDLFVDSILQNSTFSDTFDEQTAAQLTALRTWIDAVAEEEAYSAPDMAALLSDLGADVSEEQTELLYLSYAGQHLAKNDWTMTMPELVGFMSDEMLDDTRFAPIFNQETRDAIVSAKEELDTAVSQLKSGGFERIVFTTDYPEESPETTAFMERLNGSRTEHISQPSYVVGNSAMVYELENSFQREYTAITLVTAIAIFLVVLLTFRNVLVSAILTLLVQCGVYITVTIIGLTGGSMYYLALLIVQSILMGATIDYGIVFSNYYREKRQEYKQQEALRAAYSASIHTIMTSGSILVLVLAILGIFSNPFVAHVCKTLSAGALVAILLILLVLPAILTCFDRFVAGKQRK